MSLEKRLMGLLLGGAMSFSAYLLGCAASPNVKSERMVNNDVFWYNNSIVSHDALAIPPPSSPDVSTRAKEITDFLEFTGKYQERMDDMVKLLNEKKFDTVQRKIWAFADELDHDPNSFAIKQLVKVKEFSYTLYEAEESTQIVQKTGPRGASVVLAPIAFASSIFVDTLGFLFGDSSWKPMQETREMSNTMFPTSEQPISSQVTYSKISVVPYSGIRTILATSMTPGQVQEELRKNDESLVITPEVRKELEQKLNSYHLSLHEIKGFLNKSVSEAMYIKLQNHRVLIDDEYIGNRIQDLIADLNREPYQSFFDPLQKEIEGFGYYNLEYAPEKNLRRSFKSFFNGSPMPAVVVDIYYIYPSTGIKINLSDKLSHLINKFTGFPPYRDQNIQEFIPIELQKKGK